MKVAAIIDHYTLAINVGNNYGIRVGTILGIGSGDTVVVDPETGELLGTFASLRVRVAEVYARFCIAETYRLLPRSDHYFDKLVTVNIGDEAWEIK